MTKYIGEFSDKSTASHTAIAADVSVLPELSIGLGADIGTAAYLRRVVPLTEAMHAYQFGDEAQVPRTTWFNTYTLQAAVNFFPRQQFNAYLLLGAGVTFFNPDDYRQEIARVRPKSSQLAAVTIPVGLGGDFFIARNLALNAEFRFNMLLSDDFDAYASEQITRVYEQQKTMGTAAGFASEGGDAYSVLTFGLRWFLFENDDIDGDLLTNAEEESLGTNPYDADTDGDGLSDYEEVRIHHTSPVLKDTDGDGLNDYVEIMKYHTSPTLADTDGDGLGDRDEVLTHHTDPLAADSDNDGLTDAEELQLGTNPMLADTDRDNLRDSDEARVYHTDPRVADTDGDGLSDYDEVIAFKTDPRKPDTDGDGLSDEEEVVRLHTNPLLADTDGDGLSDYDETKTYATNPLNRDTDGDGIPDGKDRCPLVAGTVDGDNFDGCPHPSLHDPVASAPPRQSARTVGRVERLLRVDTLVIQEGGIMTLFGVNFEVDRDVIRPESEPILDENARLFTEYPDMRVEIRGHTDSDGGEEHNLDLSRRRADAVRRYLVSRGVESSRMTVKGFGSSSPVASNATALGKARNRRIEFFIEHKGMRRDVQKQLITGEPQLVEPADK